MLSTEIEYKLKKVAITGRLYFISLLEEKLLHKYIVSVCSFVSFNEKRILDFLKNILWGCVAYKSLWSIMEIYKNDKTSPRLKSYSREINLQTTSSKYLSSLEKTF